VASAELPKSPGHPFYTRLNALLNAADFDRFVEERTLIGVGDVTLLERELQR
jgi:hypothetical protein